MRVRHRRAITAALLLLCAAAGIAVEIVSSVDDVVRQPRSRAAVAGAVSAHAHVRVRPQVGHRLAQPAMASAMLHAPSMVRSEHAMPSAAPLTTRELTILRI